MAKTLVEQVLDAMDRLEVHHGSQAAAARACGVVKQNWTHWRNGKLPLLPTADKILAAAAKIPGTKP